MLYELPQKEHREGKNFKAANVILPLHHIDHSARYRIQGWESFLFSILKALLYYLPASSVTV